MRRAPAIALAALLIAGCRAGLPWSSSGVPTPAPAGGYRAKTPQGVDLVFDARLGLYAVYEAPGAYWLDGRFYRRNSTGWESGPGLDGPWSDCAPADLPESLRYPAP